MRITRIVIFITCALSCSMNPVWADFETGVAGIQRGDQATAFQEFRKAAIQGDAVAMKALGDMYFEGAGISSSMAMTRYWYLQSAERGNIDAVIALFLLHMQLTGDRLQQES